VSPAPTIGTAGWTIPRQYADTFPAIGTHLSRYAMRFNGVEINSSFYRPHRPATYARWAASVPAGFRFAVKVPKEITHTRRLVAAAEPLCRFLAEASALGDKIGPLLVQLPPSLTYDRHIAASFFDALRERFEGSVVCEPRHPTWFTDEADALMARGRIARVAADPARVPAAAEPGGWRCLAYYRLHGSPRMYYSGYDQPFLDALAARIAAGIAAGGTVWCVFDNTALGHATRDALALAGRVSAGADEHVIEPHLRPSVPRGILPRQ
jgi:uncharacterized protein YecE (DUF72 family)